MAGEFFNLGKLFSSEAISIGDVSPELASRLTEMLFLIRAAGVIFLLYLIFVIVNGIMNFIRNIRIRKMYNKIKDMDEKLDILLKEKENKEKKDKIEKKKKD